MTLIEVMVALLVTTVGLLGALAVVGITVKGASFSRSTTEASVLVQSKLEQKVSLPAGTTSNPFPTPSSETEWFDVNGTSLTSASGAYYTRTTGWATTSDGKRRQVTVNVAWTDAGGSHIIYASRTQALQ